MKRVLSAKIRSWADSVADPLIQNLILHNAIITGGAIVSLLQNEEPKDYDVYFRDLDALQQVAEYYVKQFCELAQEENCNVPSLPVMQRCTWNKREQKWVVLHPDSTKKHEDVRLRAFIRSAGAVGLSEYSDCPDLNQLFERPSTKKKRDSKRGSYTPIFFTTNAITLSDKIQLVLRFYGEPEKIHENYDFVHCTCWYTAWNNELYLPSRALESIINKELYYVGSKYPLCSLIRTRKFMSRGWTINAGQFVKMALQLGDLDLHNFHVFEEQLIGVDSAYFTQLIRLIRESQTDPSNNPDTSYLIQLVNLVFD